MDWIKLNTIQKRLFIFDINKIQMKATAEQRKIALKKILIWQREQQNKEKKTKRKSGI